MANTYLHTFSKNFYSVLFHIEHITSDISGCWGNNSLFMPKLLRETKGKLRNFYLVLPVIFPPRKHENLLEGKTGGKRDLKLKSFPTFFVAVAQRYVVVFCQVDAISVNLLRKQFIKNLILFIFLRY